MNKEELVKEFANKFANESINDTTKGKWFHARDGFLAGYIGRQWEIDSLVACIRITSEFSMCALTRARLEKFLEHEGYEVSTE